MRDKRGFICQRADRTRSGSSDDIPDAEGFRCLQHQAIRHFLKSPENHQDAGPFSRQLNPVTIEAIPNRRSFLGDGKHIADVETAPLVDGDTAIEEDRPWVVIVWNDPINLMSYVTFVLQKLFGYSLEKATELMLEVHHEGRSAVASGTREQAEMHVFRLHEHSLWATMEHQS